MTASAENPGPDAGPLAPVLGPLRERVLLAGADGEGGVRLLGQPLVGREHPCRPTAHRGPAEADARGPGPGSQAGGRSLGADILRLLSWHRHARGRSRRFTAQPRRAGPRLHRALGPMP
ncbi:hypothetical protein GCM10010398_54910 [Streptomyces fimbriatus]